MKVFVMGTHFEIGVKPQDMIVIRTTTTNMRSKDYTIELTHRLTISRFNNTTDLHFCSKNMLGILTPTH
nr:pectin lyase-like superfamily protein [Tanacetum cinerariifolium]